MDAAKARVLVVDDENDNLELLMRALRKDFEVVSASNAREALGILSACEVAVIVSDQRMPGMTGVELLREAARLKPSTKRLLLTGYTEPDSIIQAINEARVNYYLRKPWDLRELKATVVDLMRMRALEEENRALVEKLAETNRELAERERLLARDLDERGRELLAANAELRAKNEALASLALRDGLTGLYNHRAFQERLREELSRALRYGEPCSIVLMDLDHFKRVNDRFGHPGGDDVLKAIGNILLGKVDPELGVRESDIAARYGGEELVLLLPRTDRAGAATLAERIRQTVGSLSFFGQPGVVTMSFGIAECPIDAKTPADLVLCADQALYRAKTHGRNRVQLYGEWDASRGEPAQRPSLRLFSECAADAQAILSREGQLFVVYLDLSELRALEHEYGHSVYLDVLSRLSAEIGELPPDIIGAGDVLARGYADQASFVLLLSGPRPGGAPLTAAAMPEFCQRLSRQVQRALDRELSPLARIPVRVSLGHAMGLETRRATIDDQLGRLVREAATAARVHRSQMALADKTSLQEILVGKRLRPLYQPILAAEGLTVAGHEALIRGPAGSELEGADALLRTALAANLEWEFDAACLRTTIGGARTMREGQQLLFVNVLPPTLYDRAFAQEELPRLLAEAHLPPTQVVIEVTEQVAISNLERFRSALAPLRERGFKIALDDVGSARGNLEQVGALAPDYLKIDRAIVHGLAESPARLELTRSLIRLAKSIGARCIAEGIEKEADYWALKELGIEFVQGYLFARPAAEFFAGPSPIPEARRAAG